LKKRPLEWQERTKTKGLYTPKKNKDESQGSKEKKTKRKENRERKGHIYCSWMEDWGDTGYMDYTKERNGSCKVALKKKALKGEKVKEKGGETGKIGRYHERFWGQMVI